MNYTKLAKEARKLYNALRDEEFDAESACEIVKVCVRDYPIFREMIEEEEYEKIIGYLYYVSGIKEPIYKTIELSPDAIEVHTKDGVFKQVTYSDYSGFSFIPVERREYLKFIENDWKYVHNIDHIELF